MEDPYQEGEPLVYLPKLSEEQGHIGYLILYGIEEEGGQHHLMRMKIKT